MKYVKILGLAAIAAMALMAFVASSASATTLDGVGGAVLPAGTEIDASLASGKSAVLSTTGGITLDTCTAGTVKGTTDNETGTTVTGSVATSGLTWGAEKTACTNTTTTLEGGKLHIEWISGTSNGTVTGSGFKVTVFTPSIGVTCSYTLGTGTHLGELIGGTPATLAINATVKGAAGNSILCPASAVWTANYTVTTPTTLKVTP